MDSKALKDLKDALKCVVVSNPKETRISDLMHDYYELFDRKIPFKEFGYSTLFDFIKRGCADIFIVSEGNRNPILKPVISKKLLKINSLVQKQRITSNNGKPRRTCHYDKSPAIESNALDENKLHKKVESVSLRKKETNSLKANCSKEPTNTGVIQLNKAKKISIQPINVIINDSLKNEIISNLKILISEHPHGIWVSNLINEYKKKFNAPLDYVWIGFDSILSLCTDLPDVFKVHKHSKTDDWRLYNKSMSKQEIEHSFHLYNENLSKCTDNHYNENIEDIIDGLQALPGISINPSLYPKDCMGYEDKILKPPLPKLGSYIEVYVSHVYSPSYFWYQINAFDYGDALTNLMDEMDIFYKNRQNKYLMSRAIMKSGQFCAAVHDGMFHRASIVRNKTLDTVEVFFVDYGTIADVSTANIRFLLKSFGELPIQGFQAQLSNIIPVDKMWKQSATSYFMQLVKDKLLYAHIYGIYERSSEFILTIELIDTSLDDKDVFISEILISEGLAISNSINKLLENSEIIFKRTYDTYCSTSYNVKEPHKQTSYIEMKCESKNKNIICPNENCKITLQDIVDVHGHNIEVWSICTNNKDMISQVFLIVEQLAFMFIKPHYSKDMINYVYDKQNLENFHCVAHPCNLKTVLLNLKEHGKTGLEKGASLLVNTVNDRRKSENYISFIPLNTFAVDIVYYNSTDWLSHDFYCLFADCARFMKKFLNTH